MNKTEMSQAKSIASQVNTGLETRDRSELALSVSRALAETYFLYLKTQGVHWNVVGPLFYGVHKLTEQQYEDLARAVDELAERIRALGHPAPATFAQFLELSVIRETPGLINADDAIRHLVTDHETISRTFREAARVADQHDDIVTADMLTRRVQVREEAAWMLRSLIAQ